MTGPDEEPDLRWLLARERTTLARVRLSLVCSLVAIFLAGWTPSWVPTPVVVALGVAAAGGGLAAAVVAARRRP